MTCAIDYVNNEKIQDIRHSYELFGRVYLGSLNNGYCIDIENKLRIAFLCSFSIQGTKDVSRTADFKRP